MEEEELEELFEKFDKVVEQSMRENLLTEYIGSYLNLRDSGANFEQAIDGAAAEIGIEVDDDSDLPPDDE